MNLNLLHSLAGVSVEWLLYSLVEGTALAVLVWFLLRLLPRRNSGTRFLVWFSVLLAIALLPLLRGLWKNGAAPARTRSLDSMVARRTPSHRHGRHIRLGGVRQGS